MGFALGLWGLQHLRQRGFKDSWGLRDLLDLRVRTGLGPISVDGLGFRPGGFPNGHKVGRPLMLSVWGYGLQSLGFRV